MHIKEYKLKGSIKTDILIAVIADLHGFPGDTVVENLRLMDPDIIAIVGDLVDEKRPFSKETDIFLNRCSDIAPSYLSLGNHDYVLREQDFAAIRNAGIMILDNSWIEIGSSFYIGGLTSAYVLKCRQFGEKTDEIVLSDIEWLNAYSKLEGFKILLDHHPENYLLYTKELSIDLILSGHTHGGQISLLGYGMYIPTQKIWPRYTGGLYEERLVVSRGLSNTSFLPRVGNPTELVYVRINATGKGTQ